MLTAYDKGRLFGARTGTGAPWVLALHGWQRTHRDFNQALAGIDAIAVDLPGFGASPPPPHAWGGAGYADAVLPVLDAFDQPPVVLGHSFGGRVAVHLAAAHPDRVHALVLTGVPLLQPEGVTRPNVAWQYKLARRLRARGLVSERRIEAMRQRYGATDYRNATGVIREVNVVAVNETYERQLEAISCPVELVWGDDDTAAPVSVAVEAWRRLPDATLTRLPGVGHLVPLLAPEALTAALERRRPGMTAAVDAVTLGAAVVATGLAGVRWLRVAQREHYLPGSVSRFAVRWWSFGPNLIVGAAAVIAVSLTAIGATVLGIVTAAAVAVGPFGLGVRGRTSKLVWTRRLRTLAGVAAGLSAIPIIAVGVAAGLGPAAVTAVVVALLNPVIVDAALVVTAPVERQLASRFVDQAAAKLRSVSPTVVAVTGSYGKTSTKGYIAHLVGGTRTTVPTPASFNNINGLALAVNKHLVPGTEVFVAEMGTYGPGEIAEMCAWVRPSISVITAIGPVHLERFKSEDRIVTAKAEILETAEVAVLNVDDDRLAALADRVEAAGGKKVVRVSAHDVETLDLPDQAAPTNVACAVAVARHVGVPDDVIANRVATLPTAANRLTVGTGGNGSTIIDDTFNSNPAGVVAALAALQRAATTDSRRVVVTPGMVELGARQAEENARFAEAVAMGAGTDLLIVGHTNRRALMEGASRGKVQVVLVDTREDAVAWVRETCGPGDAILYENDLPDHYA